MDIAVGLLVIQITLALLILIISLVVAYWVIRLAVTAALKRHTEWTEDRRR